MGETLQFLQGISEEQSLNSLRSGKWTIREVLNHVNDGERLFLGRAFWFARGFQDALPSFEQDQAVQVAAGAITRPGLTWSKSFRTVRLATISFFKNLPAERLVSTRSRQRQPSDGARHRLHHRRPRRPSHEGAQGAIPGQRLNQ